MIQNSNQSRRHFLFAAGALVAAAVSPSVVKADILGVRYGNGQVITVPSDVQDFWLAPREIWLARKVTGEQEKVCYWANGQMNVEGYIRACHLLRDTHVDSTVQMDMGLLNLLRAIQGWLVYYNINEPIIVNSAYRTKYTNDHTEGAVKDSFHIRGQAVDITIPGIPTKYLFQLAAAFSAGGLGFYPGKNFVHADTGRIRCWQG